MTCGCTAPAQSVLSVFILIKDTNSKVNLDLMGTVQSLFY